MQLLEKILFPTDFSKSAEVALESVIEVARKFDSEIILLHVLPEALVATSVKEMVKERVEKIADRVAQEKIKCSFEIEVGEHAIKVVEIAERKRVNLILMGAGTAKKEKNQLGGNCEKIIRNAHVPVWVIEKDRPVAIETIVCPVDFSDESRIALDNAIHLARRFDAKLVVLHVAQFVGDKYDDLGIDLAEEAAEAAKETASELDSFLNEVGVTGVEWEKELRSGDPAEEIVSIIDEYNAGLLVMGSTGKTGLKRFLMGSVSEKVTRQVPCSFIITREEGLIHLRLEQNLDDIDALFDQGVQLAKDGYADQAIAAWKRCTAMNEFYLKAYAAIAKAYEEMGDEENARKFRATQERIQRSIWDKQVEIDLRSKHHLYNQ